MTRFPFQTAAAIATAALLLHVAERVVPGAKGAHAALWTGLADYRPALTPMWPRVERRPVERGGVPASPAAARIRLLDDSGARLDRFYQALWRAEKGEPGAVARVVHYGDSPTTGDLVTGDIRDLLHERYGDAGHGFSLLAKPWAWHQRRHIQLSGTGWKVDPALYFGSKDLRYGLAGVTFTGAAGVTRIVLERGSDSTCELWFLRRPGGGSVTLSADGSEAGEISTAGDEGTPGYGTWRLPPGARSLELRVRGGRVTLLGAALERAGPGVVYDSLGLNGGSITVLSRIFSEAHWAEQLRHRRPDLVVLNYGTNEASFASYLEKLYEKELREAIRRARAAVPEAAVLIMSPMDRGERTSDGIRTMATIPRIVAIQRRVAADTGCGFFDTFQAMGGEGTVARWYEAKPRLVSADFIHPTPQGGRLIAETFVRELTAGLNRFKAGRLARP